MKRDFYKKYSYLKSIIEIFNSVISHKWKIEFMWERKKSIVSIYI